MADAKSEILARRDEDMIPHEAAMQAYSEDDRVFEEGAALTHEIRFRTRDGLGIRRSSPRGRLAPGAAGSASRVSRFPWGS